MFTGLSTSISAIHLEKTDEPCCDECNKGDEQNTGHCSTPDCPMFLCLSINTVPPFMPLTLLESIYIHQLVEELYLKSFVKSVFHPPTIS
jgi:hypothetical protein